MGEQNFRSNYRGFWFDRSLELGVMVFTKCREFSLRLIISELRHGRCCSVSMKVFNCANIEHHDLNDFIKKILR